MYQASVAFLLPRKPEIDSGPTVVEFRDGQKGTGVGFSPSTFAFSCRYNSASSLYTFSSAANVQV